MISSLLLKAKSRLFEGHLPISPKFTPFDAAQTTALLPEQIVGVPKSKLADLTNLGAAAGANPDRARQAHGKYSPVPAYLAVIQQKGKMRDRWAHAAAIGLLCSKQSARCRGARSCSPTYYIAKDCCKSVCNLSVGRKLLCTLSRPSVGLTY